MTDEVAAEATFIFSLLDYETWNVWADGRHIGQVTFNRIDRNSEFTPLEANSAEFEFFSLRSATWWRNWLSRHVTKS